MSVQHKVSGGAFERGYHSMEDENAASSDGPSLPETLEVVADVPNWSVLGYCARHERLLDAQRFAGTFSDDHSRTMIDRWRMRHYADIGA